jgi:hypothetical protein
MVAAGNMEGQTPTRIVWWSVHHGVSTFGRLIGQEELNSIDGIIVGSDVDRKTAHLVRVVDAILVGAADNLESCKITTAQLSSWISRKSSTSIAESVCRLTSRLGAGAI